MANKVIVPQKINYVLQFLKQGDINSYYVLLLYIIYIMESGRFSQSPVFFKRAGHNVEGLLLYVLLQRSYTVLFVPLFEIRQQFCQQSYLFPWTHNRHLNWVRYQSTVE